MNKMIISLAAVLSSAALQAGTVSAVGVTEENGLLKVSYSLSEPAVVTFDATTNGVAVAPGCFKSATGDVWKLMPAGSGSFVWCPANDIVGLSVPVQEVQVRVKAWSVDAPPDYMVVNLATNATVGVSVNYYEFEAQLPGKVTDPVYKTAKLVMRKIPAANVTWRMGSPSGELGRGGQSAMEETLHEVTLTEDFYLGVYQLTVGQTAGWVSSNPQHINNMTAAGINTYSAARGTSKRWPQDGHELGNDDAILQQLRAYTGIDFDLPTEAQWEFAARAGEKAAVYTGKELSDATACDEAKEVAWYKGDCPVEISNWMSYGEVGTKKPNAYGLYDMLGNCWEFCLDRYSNDLGSAAVTDPVGATSGDFYIKRGGACDSNARDCRVAARSNAEKSSWKDRWTGNRNTGVRLWAPAKAVR